MTCDHHVCGKGRWRSPKIKVQGGAIYINLFINLGLSEEVVVCQVLNGMCMRLSSTLLCKVNVMRESERVIKHSSSPEQCEINLTYLHILDIRWLVSDGIFVQKNFEMIERLLTCPKRFFDWLDERRIHTALSLG